MEKNEALLVQKHYSTSVRDAYSMEESRLYFPKNTEPLLTRSLSVILLCKENHMHSCPGQSTWHLSSEPSDILLPSVYFLRSFPHSSLINYFILL